MSLFCGVCRKKVDVETEHVVRLVISCDSCYVQPSMVLEKSNNVKTRTNVFGGKGAAVA